jgi:hypothetical protein
MNSLARIGTIAMNTVREAIRNKLLYVLLFFAIALILTGVFLSALSYVESERILQDIGRTSVSPRYGCSRWRSRSSWA